MTSLREVRILKQLNHNNVIKLIEVCHTKGKFYLRVPNIFLHTSEK